VTPFPTRLESLSSRQLRLTASALIALPAVVLLIFAIGEMAGGDVSGAQHIPESALLLVLLVAAWRYPRPAGAILVGAGVFLAGVWIVLVVSREEGTPGGADLIGWTIAGLLLFVPPVLAGWLLLRSAALPRP
jgi:hypothetical protein